MHGEELTRYTEERWGLWYDAIMRREPHALQCLGKLLTHMQETSTTLTEAELDTLALIARGHSEKEVSELLYYTYASIRKRTASIRLKLNAHTTLQAAMIAQREGMI